MPRYVPKTYNNRRVLRVIVGTVLTIALSSVILFLVLYFVLRNFVVDGQLEFSRSDDTPAVTAPLPD